jgi:D-arabinose 1-dehydrogenase-like Zn-dependent alcohol dehydrogenase
MRNQAIADYGTPLQEQHPETPEPGGSEVLVRIRHCGVCHSDLHLQDGYFDLGDGKRLELSASHRLPLVPGHEIEGTVVTLGPDAAGPAPGMRCVVYPWIGCGECPTCARGDEQLCNRPRALGINVDGGYADHVLVPHPRYLLDADGIAPGLAGICMCSGLTAYSALRKATPAAGEALAIVGLGGVGLMGLQLARALYPEVELVAVDIAAQRRRAAEEAGVDRVVDPAEADAVRQLLKATGGVAAALDFVGSEASLAFATRILRKGGRAVVVGLFGGRYSTPIPMLPLRAISLIGSYVGTLAEARELLDLVRTGQVTPIPLVHRPLAEAEQALQDLRAGRVTGRQVLDC